MYKLPPPTPTGAFSKSNMVAKIMIIYENAIKKRYFFIKILFFLLFLHICTLKYR